MKLVYIDDVIEELIKALTGNENRNGDFCEVPVAHTFTLGEIVELLRSFKESRDTLNDPNMSNALEKSL